MDSKAPLGLPEGSVRACLALMPVVCVCVLAFLTRNAGLIEFVKEMALAGFVSYGIMRVSATKPTPVVGPPPPGPTTPAS
jgi:hypothetical protein